MVKKLIIALVVYSIILLFVGRQLPFIPEMRFGSGTQAEDLRKNVLEKFLREEKGSYSIYYKDLKTGQEFGINENKVLTAGSLNKLLIISYLYSLAGDNKINLEDKITIQKKDIQDYGTGSLRYEGEGKPYALKTLTQLALEQSDNTAAYVLSIKLGEDKIQEYGNKLGLSSTSMANNKTTARDMGKILELIYSRKITSDPLTRELLDFMKDTDFEDRLIRDLPSNVSVYHKAADTINMVHDVGIIDPASGGASDGSPFILAVLTSDVKDEGEAKGVIGKVAKFIYDRGN
ncbi:MAG: serine hydrolase [Candidatus Levybacteria bacterium]|nr:serine hydrolase [Candidatus Levybacteria bacterium]